MDRKTDLSNTLMIVAFMAMLMSYPIARYIYLSATDPVFQVRQGYKQLWCVIEGTLYKVPRTSVISYNPDSKMWLFREGYSNNCVLK